MTLLGELHRAHDGPLPETARHVARLGDPRRWGAIAARRRERSCEAMLRSVTSLQPDRVSQVYTQAEPRRWRAAALAGRDIRIASSRL